MHSSRVGVSTSAWTSCSSGSTNSIIGRPNAAVLPVPVCAWPITSRPCEQRGDRLLLDRARRLVARRRAGCGEDVLGEAEVGEGGHSAALTRASEARASARVEQRACPSCAAPAGPRARGARRRAGRSRPSTTRSSPARGALERSLQRRVDQLAPAGRRQCTSQKPTTRASSCAAARPCATCVRLARGDPVDDEPPERRRAPRGTRRTPRRRPSRARRRRGSPPLASHQRVGQVLAAPRRPRRRRRARAPARASPRVDAVAITRPAPNGLPSCTASDPTPPGRRRGRRPLSPGRDLRGGPVQVPGGQPLEQERQRGAVRHAVGDRRTSSARGRRGVLRVAAGAARARRRARRCRPPATPATSAPGDERQLVAWRRRRSRARACRRS